MIGFLTLRTRLVQAIRHRIQSGEFTERGLARKVGLSQPHIHNILKGVRSLNATTADQLMQSLGMNATGLLEQDELRHALFLILKSSGPSVEVPTLHDRLGPGFAWSERRSAFERIEVPWRKISAFRNPVVARLGPDPAMEPLLSPGDLVVLDFAPVARALDSPDDLFVVQSHGAELVRWIRTGRNRLYAFGVAARQTPAQWQVVEGGVVRARAVPLRSLYPTELVYDPFLPPRDTPEAPFRP